MTRFILVMIGLAGGCVALCDDKGKDPVKEKLFAAKMAYDKEMRQYRKLATDWLDKREEVARKDGNKKLLDQIKVDRETFDESDDLPKGAPVTIVQKHDRAKKALEDAYGHALKAYVKAKKDVEAAAVEKELLEFRKEGWKIKWKHVDLTSAIPKNDYIHIPPESQVPTVKKYTGAIEIVIVARTEADNIRLHAQKGSAVIFNWEGNLREVRVWRPDGNDKMHSGSLTNAPSTPLKPNTWYTLKWRITEEGMQISIDDKVAFEEQKTYDLTASAPITVQTIKSAVDLKEFRVTPIGKKR